MLYIIRRKVCCFVDPPGKPEFSVLCLGLTKSGKTTMIRQLLNEDTDHVPPTLGFVLKSVILDHAVMHIKEVGGSDTIRPFWERYYVDSEALVYVVDANSVDLALALSVLTATLDDPRLSRVPLLVLFLSKTGAVSDTTYNIQAETSITDHQVLNEIDVCAIDDVIVDAGGGEYNNAAANLIDNPADVDNEKCAKTLNDPNETSRDIGQGECRVSVDDFKDIISKNVYRTCLTAFCNIDDVECIRNSIEQLSQTLIEYLRQQSLLDVCVQS